MSNIRLSHEAIHELAQAYSKELQDSMKKINASALVLDNDFEKLANEIIHKLVVAKQINTGFVKGMNKDKE